MAEETEQTTESTNEQIEVNAIFDSIVRLLDEEKTNEDGNPLQVKTDAINQILGKLSDCDILLLLGMLAYAMRQGEEGMQYIFYEFGERLRSANREDDVSLDEHLKRLEIGIEKNYMKEGEQNNE